MTVIKRNGSEVTFDITKIIAAITKANESVDESIRMTPMQIQRIAESVEFSCPLRGGNTRFGGVSDHGPRCL